MSSSGVWKKKKERSPARCGTAGFPEQMLPYRSALRAASQPASQLRQGWGACVEERRAGGKKREKKEKKTVNGFRAKILKKKKRLIFGSPG